MTISSVPRLLTIADIMDLTGFKKSEVYEFMNRTDERRLPWVNPTGGERGRRVREDDYLAWYRSFTAE